MDELNKLEEKIDKLISVITELKQRAEAFEEENARLKARDKEIQTTIEGLIEKIDKLLI